MKAGIVKISADCVLELTEKEVAILAYYTAYSNEDIAKALVAKSAKGFSVREVEEVLNSIRESTSKIMAATGEARKLIFDDGRQR